MNTHPPSFRLPDGCDMSLATFERPSFTDDVPLSLKVPLKGTATCVPHECSSNLLYKLRPSDQDQSLSSPEKLKMLIGESYVISHVCSLHQKGKLEMQFSPASPPPDFPVSLDTE